MTYLVIIAFIAILASLGFALYYMLRGGQEGDAKSKRMAKALAVRVGISITLFACVLLAWQLGLIHPTGIQAGQ
ncbi:twin transmembrane helix small protein [Rhodoferax aquaticus]|uniref:Twin transmembrane helix small protein n=1 Tax=Rhodoferax aquaticus TaxID=2527691 RepID=A0A515ESN3_9BURK|nr:twin transmembrane helix small protein [Rhodoferax aquaticus]QDL55671.1 twin transmembrane helix small protein [Rhodoferax aquaticus]